MKKIMGLLLVVCLMMMGMVGVAGATNSIPEDKCEDWIETTYEEILVKDAWEETVVVEEGHWQRYSWNGGHREADNPPEVTPPHDDWQANVEGDPHNVGEPGLYHRPQGSSDNAGWFFLAWEDEVTDVIKHPAEYETVVDEEGYCADKPDNGVDPVDPVLGFDASYDVACVPGEDAEITVYLENTSTDGVDEDGNVVDTTAGFDVFVDGEEHYVNTLAPGDVDSTTFTLEPGDSADLVVNAFDVEQLNVIVNTDECFEPVVDASASISGECVDEDFIVTYTLDNSDSNVPVEFELIADGIVTSQSELNPGEIRELRDVTYRNNYYAVVEIDGNTIQSAFFNVDCEVEIPETPEEPEEPETPEQPEEPEAPEPEPEAPEEEDETTVTVERQSETTLVPFVEVTETEEGHVISDTLPKTGTNPLGLVAFGLAMLALGGYALRRGTITR